MLLPKLFLSTFLLVLPLLASAYDIEVVNADGVTIYYNYISDGTELEVVKAGNGYAGEVNIPDKVTYNGNTLPVTRIGAYAFQGCYNMTSVTIPNSVTTIGNNAFLDCTGLTSVYITDLASWCKIAFSSNPLSYAHHLFLNGEEIKDLVIPNSVTSIGHYAFWSCSGLTSVTIPNSVTTIGNGAFRDCTSLTSVTIPNSVTSIGGSAFSGCTGLTSVYITDLAAWCKIDFSDSESNPLYSAHHLLLNSEEVKDLVIPNNVTTIGGWAFRGCEGLTSVTIPNSVTTIGHSALAYCTGLTSVTIPNSVTTIEDATFYGCTGLTSVIIGNSVTTIGNAAFRDCYRLNTIYCLTPIPPTCFDNTFWCNDVVRDKYDVYTYANLHVPMGSKEIYSAAHEWRYFEKIKEDMQQDGNVYYANLTVQQGTTGYTRQAIKAGETYTIYIGSFGENRVNAVTFNGVDVTEEIVNGNYTTPEITGESVLCISYEMPSSVPSLKLNDVKVMGYDGEITISNIDAPSDISIYSVDGKTVDNIPSALGSARISVTPNQLYVVKVGNRTYKIAL